MGVAQVLPFLQQYAQQMQAPPPDAQPAQPAPAQAQAPAQTQAPAQVPLPPPAPEETKGHKLLELLRGGLTGALSGLAANAQTYAQTGRNAGIGGGIGAGFTQSLPMQQQFQQAELGQKQAQTELTKQQATMVQTPYGPLPATLAKLIFPAAIKAGAEVQSATIGAGAKKDVAQTQAQTQQAIHRYVPVQGVGLFDTQTRQVMPGTAASITITPEIAQDHNLPQEFIGKPMKLSELSQMERVENQQTTTVQGTNGPALVNKQTGKTTSLGLGNPGMGKPMEVGDPDNPGETKVVTGATAVASGAPGKSSASVAVPRKAAEGEVPTKIGDQKVAFTTMIQHAELLRDAARALGNGDVQTLAGLKNAFKNEFGYSGPITAKAIADAYGGEVTNVISKGHITDAEMAKTGKTLDPEKQNFETINNVLNGYQALAQSKMNMLTQQQQNAVNKSQPSKKGAAPSGRRVIDFTK